MRYAVGATNLILGVVYTSYGIMTIEDMRRGWKTMGFSHFGAGWIAMAFTCGPHHLFHGLHALFEGRAGGSLDLAAVLVGFPAGVTWFLLRIEAFRGGRGDRFVSGSPAWVLAIPSLAGVYVTGLIAASIAIAGAGFAFKATIVPNAMLVILYCAIGYFLTRTQLRNREPLGGWSVSGLSLAVIFPTCAFMHGVFFLYSGIGQYAHDVHGFAIDWLAVPAAAYFLWVVRGLYIDALRDWNNAEAPEREEAPAFAR
ncbi:MAG: hypothetical protein ACRDJ1_09040 [Actinomycetota bacterium]